MIKSIIKSIFNYMGMEIHRGKRRYPFEDQSMLLNPDEASVIFDVGAYTGTITEKYKKLFPKATIYCFEPFQASFKKLQEHYKACDRIKTFRMAVGDRTGKRTFYLNSDLSCNSLLRPLSSRERYSNSNSEVVDTTKVDVITLEDFCRKESISRINILKLDVEGSELSVLKGASELLKQEVVDLIYTEVMFVAHYEEGVQFFELSRYLFDYGYTIFNLYDLKRSENGQIRWGNAVFVSPHIRAAVINKKK